MKLGSLASGKNVTNHATNLTGMLINCFGTDEILPNIFVGKQDGHIFILHTKTFLGLTLERRNVPKKLLMPSNINNKHIATTQPKTT
jgi:hypothetical protein